MPRPRCSCARVAGRSDATETQYGREGFPLSDSLTDAKAYVKRMRVSGVSDADILARLRKAGWSEEVLTRLSDELHMARGLGCEGQRPTAVAAARSRTCPYCQTTIATGEQCILCAECQVPHPPACWVENGGCTTYGCHHGPSGEPPVAAAMATSVPREYIRVWELLVEQADLEGEMLGWILFQPWNECVSRYEELDEQVGTEEDIERARACITQAIDSLARGPAERAVRSGRQAVLEALLEANDEIIKYYSTHFPRAVRALVQIRSSPSDEAFVNNTIPPVSADIGSALDRLERAHQSCKAVWLEMIARIVDRCGAVVRPRGSKRGGHGRVPRMGGGRARGDRQLLRRGRED